MKIAIVYSIPPGGAMRTVYETTKRIAKQHEVLLFQIGASQEEEYWKGNEGISHQLIRVRSPRLSTREKLSKMSPSLRIFTQKFLKKCLNPSSMIYEWIYLHAIYKKLGGVINNLNPDIMIVHSCRFFQAPPILRDVRCPTIYYLHEAPRWGRNSMPYDRRFFSPVDKLFNLLEYPERALYARTNLSSISKATMVLTNSYFNRNLIWHAHGIKAEVCYPGVDVEKFGPLGISRENSVLTVGNIYPHKGHDFIIRSLGLISEKYRPSLRIIGPIGKIMYADYLIELARNLGVKLDIKTRLHDDSLANYYNRALLTVCGQINEALGLIALESMACGTPVVAVNEGGFSETVIDGVTGSLVGRNEHLFARSIERYLKDPALVEEMGRNARQHVLERWTWDHSAERLRKYIEKCINANN